MNIEGIIEQLEDITEQKYEGNGESVSEDFLELVSELIRQYGRLKEENENLHNDIALNYTYTGSGKEYGE